MQDPDDPQLVSAHPLAREAGEGAGGEGFCAATTKAGNPCRFAARRATGLCINHDPTYKEQQARNVATGARNAAIERTRRAATTGLPPVPLSDHAAIQAFLEATVALELTAALPAARTRNLVRLAIAAITNLETNPAPLLPPTHLTPQP